MPAGTVIEMASFTPGDRADGDGVSHGHARAVVRVGDAARCHGLEPSADHRVDARIPPCREDRHGVVFFGDRTEFLAQRGDIVMNVEAVDGADAMLEDLGSRSRGRCGTGQDRTATSMDGEFLDVGHDAYIPERHRVAFGIRAVLGNDLGDFDDADKFHVGFDEDGFHCTAADIAIAEDGDADLVHRVLRLGSVGW